MNGWNGGIVEKSKEILKELNNYRAYVSEINALEYQIEQLHNTYHSPSWEGVGGHGNSDLTQTEQALHQIDTLEQMYLVKRDLAREKLQMLEEWISTVEDKNVQNCIRWHYMIGCTWKETTKRVFGEFTAEQNSKLIVRRYFGYKG